MRVFAVVAAIVSSLVPTVVGQSSSSNSSSFEPAPSSTPAPSISLSVSPTTINATLVFTTTSDGGSAVLTTVVPTTFNVTRTISLTSSSSLPSFSQSPTPSYNPYVLETRLDPAFGVLGSILILTGLPSTFWGHKNRWSSFFLIGFYTLSLVCFVLILKFGILAAINPPTRSLRGLFVLATAISGIAGGAIAIFFWKAARYGIGAWGGFALALWIQCFRSGGVIKPIGLRWILYIGCTVIGFVLCTIPRVHYHVLLISTAFVGSSAFMLGVDCFTTAGLKEFYIWNLGFESLFPKFINNYIQFPVSQTMQIELGLMGAIALMGAAVQLRILSVLHTKLEEIGEEQKKRDEEAEALAAERFAGVEREQVEWEREHPTRSRHDRQESGLSSLLKEKDGSVSPPDTAGLSYTQDGQSRKRSPTSDFRAAPALSHEFRHAAQNSRDRAVLPILDLGLAIQENVPHTFMTSEESRLKEKENTSRHIDLSPLALEELRRKEELVLEIQNIRRSIEALKSETPIPSSSDASRRPSLASRRTLSIDANSALLPAPTHLRPPREMDPRTRVHSMDMVSLGHNLQMGQSISRPSSAPIRDEDWNSYVQERKLLQPPAGVTPPIATTHNFPTARIAMAPAITDALIRRKERESALGGRDASPELDDVPLARIARQSHAQSPGSKSTTSPVTILPPRRASPLVSPTPQRSSTRTRTFEELNERHRVKMRDMQAPLTMAEQEEANIRAARQRWERSKALEKEAFTRRQAEKVALIGKKKRVDDLGHKTGKTRSPDGRHERSLGNDRLASFSMGSSSKRLSTLKVEDWQKYQQDLAVGSGPTGPNLNRMSHSLSPPGDVASQDRKKQYSRKVSREVPN